MDFKIGFNRPFAAGFLPNLDQQDELSARPE
jgi:hypothetical protein